MKHTPLLTLALTVAMLVGSVTCQSPPVCPVSVVTFNTNLTPLVYGYEKRRSAVPEALKKSATDADVMCLQELWFEADLKKVLDAVGTSFPYHYSPIHYKIGQLQKEGQSALQFWLKGKNIPCSWSQLALLNLCLLAKCVKAPDQQWCMVNKCNKPLFFFLSDTCRSCVSVASSDPLTVWQKCSDFTHRYHRMNSPGLLLLSKKKLTSVKYVKFHNGSLVERGYIKAQVENGPTYVCTHLTAVFPVYYDVELTQYNSYTEMQRDEISKLNEEFSGSDHVLLGDLNAGPETNTLSGEAQINYDWLTRDLGYRSPYMQKDGRCTYCHDNPVLLADNKTFYQDMAIDHVLLASRFRGSALGAKRVLDQPMLSDHYGVQVDMDYCPQ